MKVKEYSSLEELFDNRIFYHFREISKIPHGSHNEKELSDFIFTWAKDLNLKVYQDELYNLLIKNLLLKGYENCKPIILQAHLDMVCEKNIDINHDFTKDPIHLELDNDILSTGNRTTLGADNGIGVSLAMTVLESNTIEHPPVDVIFTTAEEDDLSGALGVNPSWFSTNRLINLDNAVDNKLVLGSSGGKGVELSFPLDYTIVPSDWSSYKINITGLKGGHSGEEIDKGLGNANILLARLLNKCRKEFDYLISDINGGNFRLAIPRSAYASITLDSSNVDLLEKIIERVKETIPSKKYISLEPIIDIKLEKIPFQPKSINKECSNKIIDSIILSPNGISEMLGGLNVVESSCNLGEVYIKDSAIYLITEIRATYNSNREYIYEKINVLSRFLNGTVKEFAIYPSWTYKANSDLKNLAQKTYKTLFDEEMINLVVHAGLEPGCFSTKVNDLDAISIGPNHWNLHSPSESLSVSSTNKVYSFLVEILRNLD